jgi:flagellar biosynthetic protein FliQ
MNGAEVLDVGRDAVFVLLRVSGPLMLIALVTGVVIALIQAVTQIQEMTLTFVPKILALFAALLALLPFMSVTLATFMERVADQISAIP